VNYRLQIKKIFLLNGKEIVILEGMAGIRCQQRLEGQPFEPVDPQILARGPIGQAKGKAKTF